MYILSSKLYCLITLDEFFNKSFFFFLIKSKFPEQGFIGLVLNKTKKAHEQDNSMDGLLHQTVDYNYNTKLIKGTTIQIKSPRDSTSYPPECL